ncbi:MAG: amidase [Solirubrobacterales bacterium]
MPAAVELARLDATAQAELVRTGEASVDELATAAVERIEALNPTVNAVIHPLFEEGLAAAGNGLPDGPFRGVPFLLKDIGASFAGQPLHMGARALRDADFRAPVDSYLAQRFRAAGLVTLGKTNVPELGLLPTSEPVAFGATRNPWDLERSPGGSSGGAAAAVASGMVPVAHANDGAGSIRIPASACGLVGLKPTRQRVTEGPAIGDVNGGMSCELIVSRSVRDTAAMLDAVHGPAPGDPYAAPPPARPYVDELDAEPAGLRVGLMSRSLSGIEVAQEVVDAAVGAGELLEELGHSVEESAPDGFEDLSLVDTFVTRWEAGAAAGVAMVGALVGRRLGAGDLEPLTHALAERGRQVSAPQYLAAINRHQMMSRLVAGWYESGFDLLLTPTLGEPPPPLGSYDDTGPDPMVALERAKLTGAFAGAFNVTGQPAISLPLHWSDEGIPIGVQLVAPFGREDVLIAVAAQLERARPWAERTPQVFAGRDA